MRSWIRAAALLLAVVALSPGGAGAQPFDLDKPADSPLWWTLTDEVTPEELRAAYTEPGSSQRRYREAVAAGLEPPRTDAQLARLKFYLNRRLNPELETLGSLFGRLADPWLRHRGEETLRRELAGYGVSAEGADRILGVAKTYAEELEELVSVYGPKHKELIRVHWEILNREGWNEETKRSIKEAVRSNDVASLAERSGRSEAEVADLLAAWEIQPSSHLLETTLPKLRSELSPADWQALRRFLYDQVPVALSNAFKDF